nr:immunoglobulin heavy chain junction region [Mus musculus]
CARDSWFAYW